ncbi:MAG: SRPBCC domain-containing protein [Gracilimonas sp.]
MEFKEGGYRLYAMIGPNNEEHWGRTDYTSIEHLKNFTGDDVFCDENGTVNKELPAAHFATNFNEVLGQTEIIMITEYESEEQLKQIIKMGMKDGLSMAFKNLDEVLEKEA